jgi:hypothetical protein
MRRNESHKQTGESNGKGRAGGQEATADGFLTGVCTPVLGRPKPHPKVLSPAGGVGTKDSNKDRKIVKREDFLLKGAVSARFTNRADNSPKIAR